MAVFIDRSFLLQISPKLKKFSQKKEDLYNFRCPFCGDSEKNKLKARGYVYRKKNGYFYMCHNCGISTTFYNLLDKVDSNLLKEYTLERYKNESGNNNVPQPDFKEFQTETPKFKKKLDIPSIESLPDGHFAKDYVLSRKIPKESLFELYFAEDFKNFVVGLGIQKDGLKENDPRLVIPFYNENKELICLQGRSLGESKLRYITVKITEDDYKIFGLDRINKEEMIYVVEGPIDSLFLKNALATADSNLSSIEKLFDRTKVTLVFDNEPRNKDICNTMEKAIENHFNVVIWPDMMEEYKDLNEMILGGFSPDEIQDIISKSTFVNLRAKMEFISWKKV